MDQFEKPRAGRSDSRGRPRSRHGWTKLEVLDVSNGCAQDRLGGVCGTCPSSIMAAVMGIEEILRQHVAGGRGTSKPRRDQCTPHAPRED